MKIKKLHFALVAFATISFQLLTHNTQAQAHLCFTPASSITAVGQPKSIASADFNHDGHIDLATIGDTCKLSIKLGNGTGSFSNGNNYTICSTSSGIISADFNLDGNADLAFGTFNSISIMLGDGAGNFGAATSFSTIKNPQSFISADINGDGFADLVTVNSIDTCITVLLNNGAGGFGTASIINMGFIQPTSIICADFSGDGFKDLAVANRWSNNVSIMLGDGTGGFGAISNFSVGAGPSSIVSADFNGDGFKDLATANFYASKVSVLFGNGTGGFGAAATFSADSMPVSIISADFNLDGKADLAVAHGWSNNISVLLGNGAGSFNSPVNFVTNGYTYGIITADFNGDGKADLAEANYGSNNVSILLNSPLTVTADATATTACAGTPVTLTGGGANYYTWSPRFGLNDSTIYNPIATPASTTTYTLTGTTTSGCSGTATKTITVNPLPVATFTTHNESSSLYCDGSIIGHLAGGTGIIQDQWLNSSQTVLSSTDSIIALCSGAYTLNLTDVNNCTNTYTQNIQAGPIPPIPPICLVTVDSTYTHNLLIWEKTNLNMTPIDSFVVYREITTNNYQRIGAVVYDSLSVFNDLGANPASTGYRYKLKSKNNKGVTSLFSDYHNTIYLTNTSANFNWTPYQIENNTTPVSTYNIYRDNNSTGNFILIGNTTGNQFGFTDTQYSSFPNSSYYVEAVMTGGVCTPTRSGYAASRSNVKHIGSNGVQQLNNNTAINIYPNPATSMLYITGITGKTIIHLYDVVGKLIMETEIENNTTINTSQMAEGVYTLSTTSKMGNSINKVVISR